ncbi:DUF4291 family protein [Kineosporia succinea]|uniref:Uncharacterized protein n=1 Tax=Kineosporia succinea TaxID=84632 RepID=A0ABT9NV21_9ACTN|nr:hypothetical protein [Kineosporia succinea]
MVPAYVDEWTLSVTDVTPLAHEIHELVRQDETARARALLPVETPYDLPEPIARPLGATQA